MDKVVLTVWVVYLVGFTFFPLVDGLISGLSLRSRHYLDDRGFELFMILMKSVFWPVIAVGGLWILWTKTLGEAGERVHDRLVEYKHRRDK